MSYKTNPVPFAMIIYTQLDMQLSACFQASNSLSPCTRRSCTLYSGHSWPPPRATCLPHAWPDPGLHTTCRRSGSENCFRSDRILRYHCLRDIEDNRNHPRSAEGGRRVAEDSPEANSQPRRAGMMTIITQCLRVHKSLRLGNFSLLGLVYNPDLVCLMWPWLDAGEGCQQQPIRGLKLRRLTNERSPRRLGARECNARYKYLHHDCQSHTDCCIHVI